MEIVGHGFIAKNLEPITSKHSDLVVLAAGVSSTAATSEADFGRERTLLECAIRRCVKENRRLLFFSTASSGLYAGENCTGREDAVVTPRTPYAKHKLEMERLILESEVGYIVARLSHLVGAHQRAHQLIPALVAQLRSGRIQVRGGTRRDLLDVRDMVQIIDALLDAEITREVVNVASGFAVPIEEIVDYLESRLGLQAERDYVAATDSGVISIEKLSKLVPEIAELGFGLTYYREALDAFLEAGESPVGLSG